MLATLRAEAAGRLAEVRQLLDVIRQLEATPPTPDPPEVRILRALFFVHLYAAFEFTVSQGVQRLLQEVAKLNISPSHFDSKFHAVALDANFSSFRNVGEDKRWSTRISFLDQQVSSNALSINADIFYLYLQNVWIEKLEVLFGCLCIHQPVVPDPSYRLYVDELVERRNGIAHGRFSALGIGGSIRSPELQIRLAAIGATCTHILDCFEQQERDRLYILPSHRTVYP